MCLSALCSCAASCCMGCCCSSLKDCKVKHGPGSRIPYIFIMFVMCIFAVVMGLYGDEELYDVDLLNIEIKICDTDKNEACEATSTVYRVSFCLFVFFMIHTIVVKFVASFHWLFFGIKLVCLIAVLVLTYFIPSDPFDAYANFARIASIVFLLLQVIVLISWAYDVSDRVVDKVDQFTAKLDEEESKQNKAELCCIQFGLIFVTLLIYVAIGIFIGFMYGWFEPSKDCQFGSTIIGLTIVLVLVMTVLPIFLRTGSIFTTGVVSFYVTYLAYAALENVPKEECNTFAQDTSSGAMWIGIIITTVAICYVGFSISSKRGVLMGNDENRTDDIQIELEAGTNQKKSNGTGDDAGTVEGGNYEDDANLGESNYDDAKPSDNKKHRKFWSRGNGESGADISDEALRADQKDNVLFHLVMAFASVYVAMLYTNWGTNATYGSDQAETRSWEAVWINISAQWVTIVLFIWTAVAPKVCPGRFGIVEEE